MQDFEPWHAHYHHEPHNSTHPAYAFRLSTRDLARFGLLYLREGTWRDTKLVPPAWVHESTRSYSQTPSGGYGYMWWIERGPFAQLGAYAAAGVGGQRVHVIPRAQLVIVHRADTYLKKEVADHDIRRLIEKILRARIEPPVSQPTLVDMPEPRPADEAFISTETEIAALCGEYVHGRTGVIVRQSGGRLESRSRPAASSCIGARPVNLASKTCLTRWNSISTIRVRRPGCGSGDPWICQDHRARRIEGTSRGWADERGIGTSGPARPHATCRDLVEQRVQSDSSARERADHDQSDRPASRSAIPGRRWGG